MVWMKPPVQQCTSLRHHGDNVSLELSMALHFVSTSTVSSSDGINFDTEEVKESQEVAQARRAAEASSNKSLFAQLSEQQEKKQAEYDAQTKLIFAPPKCLDEEDVDYFNEVNARHKEFLESQKEKDEKQLEEFRKKSSSVPTSSAQLFNFHNKKDENKNQQPVVIVKRKKKNEKNDSSLPESKRAKATADKEINVKISNKDSNQQSAPKSKDPEPEKQPLSSLFSAYGSDSDDGEC